MLGMSFMLISDPFDTENDKKQSFLDTENDKKTSIFATENRK